MRSATEPAFNVPRFAIRRIFAGFARTFDKPRETDHAFIDQLTKGQTERPSRGP